MIWQLIYVLGKRHDCTVDKNTLESAIIRGYIAFRNVELATQWNLTCLAGKGGLQKLSVDGMNYAPRTGDGYGEDHYGDAEHSTAPALSPAFPISEAEADRYIFMTNTVRLVRLSDAITGNQQVLTFPTMRPEKIDARAHTYMTPDIDLTKQRVAVDALKEQYTEARNKTKNPFEGFDDFPGIPRTMHGTSTVRQLKDAYCAFIWNKAKSATLKELQLNICALHVICIWGYIDFLAKTADSYEQFLIAIIGPGGSGKTFMENQVIRPAIRHFFGDAADKAVAPNNAAAKCLGQATTMHLACKYKQSDVLAKREMNQKLTITKKMSTRLNTRTRFRLHRTSLPWQSATYAGT